MNSSQREKENLGKTRCSRTKKQQFDLMNSFHNENNVEVLDTITYNRRWNELTVKLNAMGPPEHSENEWKRVWSERKYNKKRKRTDEGLSSTCSYQKLSETDVHDASTASSVTSLHHHFYDQICLPSDSLIQDCTMLFHNVYDQSYDFNQQFGAQNTGLNNELYTNVPVLTLPENPVPSFVCDQPIQPNTVDSDKTLKLLSEISKKLDLVIDLQKEQLHKK